MENEIKDKKEKEIKEGIKKTAGSEYEDPNFWDNLLVREFNKESDRAAAIITATLFDGALETLLKNYLAPMPTSNDNLFDGPNASLSDFNSKISIAFRLGLISPKFTRDLNLIRKIRNEFAHSIEGSSFEQASIRNKVLELRSSSKLHEKISRFRAKIFPKGTRGDFLMNCSWMLFALYRETNRVKQIECAPLEFGYAVPDSAIREVEELTESVEKLEEEKESASSQSQKGK